MVDQQQPPGTEREQRAEEMRRRLLTAAASVFSRKGFHKSTTKEIAAEAGLAEGTIYNYFPSKRDLLIAMMQAAVVPSLIEILSTSEEVDTRTLLTTLLHDRLALLQRFHGIAIVLLTELMTDEELRKRYFSQVVAPMVATVQAHMARRKIGTPTRRPNLRVVLPALVGGAALSMAAQNLLPQSALAGPSLSNEELISQLVDFFLFGLEGQPQSAISNPKSAMARGGEKR